MRKPISQREARRLQKRVEELDRQIEAQRRSYGQDWPGGSEIARVQWAVTDVVPVAVKTARLLKHAVVAVGDDTGLIRFVALPQAKV